MCVVIQIQFLCNICIHICVNAHKVSYSSVVCNINTTLNGAAIFETKANEKEEKKNKFISYSSRTDVIADY